MTDRPGALEETVPITGEEGGAPVLGASIGRYAITGSLGKGGMGVVIAARDTELDRKVAIKVLHAGSFGPAATARLEREAQAMAKLSHPNVVTVYEVGRVEGLAFIAMELVEGETLRRWCESKPRTWREIVAMYVAAGRGLAAAHAAGLVHRDFKPDNVLVGDDRPRVLDFGLVSQRFERDELPALPWTESSPPTMTTRGSLVGTPAYMAPEQWRGEELDARADQFAFAVSLWEALWGKRPFGGTTPIAIRDLVLAGEVPALASRRGVPRRIERALRRALARRPAERWASLERLLDELERASRDRRPLIIGGAALLATGGAVAVLALKGADANEQCPVPTARASAVWSDARRDAIVARIGVLDRAIAPAFANAAQRFDRAIGSWRDGHVAACRANKVDGRDSDALLDQRMQCLDRWLVELDSVVALFEAAPDRKALDKALEVSGSLTSSERCADREALAKAPAAPPQVRAESDAIRTELEKVDVQRRAGNREQLVESAQRLVDRARAIDHAPTLASALKVRAEVAVDLEDHETAKGLLEELANVAGKAGSLDLVATAWITSIRVMRALQRPDEAKQLIPVARSAIELAGNHLDQRVALLTYEASLIGSRGEPERAHALLEEARKLLVDAGAERPDSEHAAKLGAVWMGLGGSLGSLKRYDESIAAFREAIRIRTALSGPDHPDLVSAHLNVAESLRRAGKLEDALEESRTAVRIAEVRSAESAVMVRALTKVAADLVTLRRNDEGLEVVDRAFALAAKVAPTDVRLEISIRDARALALRQLGQFDRAVAEYDAMIALREKSGVKPPNPASDHFNRGGTKKEAKDYAGAIADYAHSVALLENAPGQRDHLVPSLIGLGESYVLAKRHAEAVKVLERALGLDVEPRYAKNKSVARYYLARALIESRKDVKRGIAEANAAKAQMQAEKQNLDWIPEVDALLAKVNARGGTR